MYSVKVTGDNTYNKYGPISSPIAISPSYPVSVCKQISVGYYTGHLIDHRTGMVWSGGYRDYGQIGDNFSSTGNTTTYMPICRTASYSTVIYGSFAIDAATGMIWAWGNNAYGQLGINSITNQSSPVAIARSGSYSVIDSWNNQGTENKTLAIDAATGNIWAWGVNTYGSLGVGDITNRSSPTQIARTASYTKISIAGAFGYAIDATTGMIWAWGGTNGGGTLGDNSLTRKSSPISIARLGSYSHVSGGSRHALAIDAATGMVYAWGYNDYYQLGTGDKVNKSSPVAILRTDSYIAVAAGAYQSFAVDYLGQGWAWGRNATLGVGFGVYIIPVPLPIIKTSSYSSLALNDHNMALIEASTGNIYTMGDNNSSRAASVSTFVQILRTASYSQVQGRGSDAFYTIDATTGNIWVWGNESLLGDNTITAKSSPVQIARTASYSQVAAGVYTANCASLAIDATTGNIWGWGINTYATVGSGIGRGSYNPPGYSALYKEIDRSTSYSMVSTCCNGPHTLAIDKATGNVYAWGSNNYGQLGLGFTKSPATIYSAYDFSPTCIQRTASYSAIAAGTLHSLAIDATTGNIWAWGYNNNGQLGINNVANKSSPVAMVRIASYNAIAAGSNYSLAIDAADGMIYAWGNNDYNQLGLGITGNKSSPIAVARVGSYSQIRVGWNTSHAIDASTGMIYSWGTNNDGELSVGDILNRNSPTPVSRVSSYSNISAGGYISNHLLAIDAYTGNVFACGNNSYYTLGVDLPIANKSTFTAILRTASYSQVCAGAYNSFAIEAATGYLYYWGQSVIFDYGSLESVSSPTLLNNSISYKSIQASGAIFVIEGATDHIFAWGMAGDGGSLGYASGPYSSPVACVRTASYSKVSVGQYFAMAIDASNGMIYSWGYNANGQLGDNTIIDHVLPKPICRTSSYSFIYAGNSSYAIDATTGMVYAWGYNYYGQLGDGTQIDRSSPVAIARVGSYTEVGGHTYMGQAIDAATGMIYTWGQTYNQNGSFSNKLSPVPVLRTSSYSKLQIKQSSGGKDACAAIDAATGNVWAWGFHNTNLSLGMDTETVASPIPIVITGGLSDVSTKLSEVTLFPASYEAYGDFVSDGYRIATLANIHFTGNFYNQTSWLWSFGDGGTSVDPNPDHFYTTENDFIVSLVTVGPYGNPYTYTQSISIFTPFILSTSDQLYLSGYNATYALGNGTIINRSSMALVTSTKFIFVTTDYNSNNTMALDDYSNLWAWGANTYGQFGNNSKTTLSTPTLVRSGPILYVNNHPQMSAIIDQYGMIYTSGYNTGYGNLGTNSPSQLSNYTAIARTSSYSKVVVYAGGYNMLAIDATDGMVYTWGYGSNSAIGNNSIATKYSPVAIARTASYSQIAAGNQSAFALDAATGMIYAWGYNGAGGVGDNSLTNKSSPVAIARSGSYSHISAGDSFCLAIEATTGNVWGWGYEPVSLITKSSPILITSGSFVQISGNGAMIDSSGLIYAWGRNVYGEFGTRDTIARSTPSIIAKIV